MLFCLFMFSCFYIFDHDVLFHHFCSCTVTLGCAISGMQCAKRSVSVAPLAWMLQNKAGVPAAAGGIGAASCDLNEAQALYLPLFAEVIVFWAGIL